MLKHGDRIKVDVYEFEFAIEGMAAARNPARWRPTKEGHPPGRPATASEQAPAQATEEGTRLKPDYCPNHPRFPATQICPECQGAFCKCCMGDSGFAQPICIKCLNKIGVGYTRLLDLEAIYGPK